MSFLLVKGRTLNCEVCGSRRSYDYIGGAQRTQVSDPVIWEQNLLKIIFPQPDPLADGWYIQTVGICEQCWNKGLKMTEKPGTEDRLNLILKKMNGLISNERENSIQGLTKLYQEHYGQMNLEGLRSISPPDWMKSVGNPGFANRKPLGQCSAAKQYARLVASKMMRELQSIVWAESEIPRKCLNELATAAKLEVKNLPAKTYNRVELGGYENLNPYIITDNTIRDPAPGQEPNVFWLRGEDREIQWPERVSKFAPPYLDLCSMEYNDACIEVCKQLLTKRLFSLLGLESTDNT